MTPLQKIIYGIILVLPLYLAKVVFFGVPTNLLEISIIGALLFGATKYSYGKIWHVLLRRHKNIVLAIGAILLGGLLSTIVSQNYMQGFGILKGWFAIPLVFAFLVYGQLQSAQEAKIFLRAVFYSGVIVALIALVYYLFGQVTYDGRLRSFFLSPNHLAMYLAPAIVIGILNFEDEILGQREKKKRQRILWQAGSLVTILLFAVYLTKSYAAWGAIGGSIFLMSILRGSVGKTKIKNLVIVIGLIVLLFSTQLQSQRGTDFTEKFERSSLASRMMIWKVALKIGAEHPFFGIGPGNFQTVYLAYQIHYPPYLEWAVPQPHNIFLAFWLQTGIIGLGGFIVLLFLWARPLIKGFYINKNPASAGVLGVMFYMLFHGLIDTPYWKNDLAIIFWLVIVIGLFISWEENNPKKEHYKSIR